jgi:hypothetical protein
MKTPVKLRMIEELDAYGNNLGSLPVTEPKSGTADYYEYDGYYEVIYFDDGDIECNQLQELPEL